MAVPSGTVFSRVVSRGGVSLGVYVPEKDDSWRGISLGKASVRVGACSVPLSGAEKWFTRAGSARFLVGTVASRPSG